MHPWRMIGLLVAVVLTCCTAARGADGARPNIVFILTDDLGVYDLACYGRREHPTPHLDQLAREGMRFTSAYCAQPICSPSRAAILTGQAPARLHLTTFLPGRADATSQRVLHPKIEQQLPLAEQTLAEALRDAGYATACVGKWHLGGKGFQPQDQGFEFIHAGRPVTTPGASEGGKGEYDLTATALRFVETNRSRPFFLFLAHNSPHIPYSARTNLVAKHARAFEPAYAAMIETLDDTVGLLLRRLDALNLTTNTIVVFTSDNGGLHVPELKHERVTHNGPFRAGKGYLYEGGLRIPLIVRWPGRVPAARVEATPLMNTDWMPTLLELAGAPVPANLDGASMARLLTGGTQPERTLAWHFPHYTNQGGRPGGAIRVGDWKLIEFYDAPGERPELYNLAADPGEQRNLAGEEMARVAELQQRLKAWIVEVKGQTNAPNPAFQPESWKALYEHPDPSRFSPVMASASEWEQIQAWRKRMDEVVRRK